MKAEEIIDRDGKVIPPLTRVPYPLVMHRGEGSRIWDCEGREYLDFSSGIAVLNVGHAHPRVLEAAREQMERLPHAAFSDFYSGVPVSLAERLCGITGYGKVFFSNSGTEAVEAAMKAARYHTGRKKLISFYGSFHGRTYGSLSLTSSKVVHKRRLGPTLPEVYHVPYADCYRCPFGQERPCNVECIAFLEETLFRRDCDPSEVAALFVEPIQGEGGIIIPPVEFHRELRRICDENGILLVADEVQTGMGRTGRFLAMEHFGVRPDVVTLAKSLGGGFPIGATLSTAEVFRWEGGTHASTFGGNLVACAAGLAVLNVIEEEGLLRAARERGETLRARLDELMEDYPFLDHVRGLGLFVGVEVVKSRETREPDRGRRDALLKACFRKGVIVLGAGSATLRLIPPLTILPDELEEGVERLGRALKAVSA
jgi:4-aminobutyrate aminotransferase